MQDDADERLNMVVVTNDFEMNSALYSYIRDKSMTFLKTKSR